MTDQPAVSVIMPVYNAAAHLAEALDSLLAQTFADFELIALDDGSTDATGALLAAYAAREPRLRVVHGPSNCGVVAQLNQAIDLARGRYIARMDGDDICLPGRLARQVALLDTRPQVAVCGSWVQIFGDAPTHIRRYPADDAAIRCELLFRNVLAHPATMLRGELLRRHNLRYDRDFAHAEDYELWMRLAAHGGLANIPEVLLRYRMHAGQVGQQQRAAQVATAARVRLGQLRALGLEPTLAEQATHELISTARFEPARAQLDAADGWLQRILAANQLAGRYAEPALRPVLAWHWYTVCRLSTTLGPWAWLRFWRSPLARAAPIGQLRLAKFLLKALARASG